MKNIVIGICSFVLLGLLLLIIFTLHGRSIRLQELNGALISSMQSVMERLQGDTVYAPKSNDELIAMFQQEFLMQMESHSQVTLHILGADYEKGFLSAEAVLTYMHPIGKQGSVSARKTVIIERAEKEKKAEMCSISYLVEGKCYKKYNLPMGIAIKIPAEPYIEGKQFLGWRDAEGKDSLDLGRTFVQGNRVFIAVFQ